jgi:hypothetical protein
LKLLDGFLKHCGNQPGLFVLRERSGDLPHHLVRGIATVGQVVAAGSEIADAALDQRQDAQLGDISPR